MYRLSIGSYSLEIKNFRESNEPRTVANPASGEYTALGSTVVKGSAVAAKNIWVIQCWLTPDETDVLNVIYAESERLRRAQQAFGITIEDYVREYYETTPRSRALATGASTVTVSGSYIKYFAKYRAMFNRAPEVMDRRFKNGVNFTLTEMDTIAA